MAKVTRLSLDNSGELDRRRLNFREISGDPDAPLESVGQDLRKARERKGEELDHISRVLKIRLDYLAAIEDSRMDSLPGRAYAIGFVRSYATYLGLDGEDCVERMKAEVAGRGDKEGHTVMSAPSDRGWPQGARVIGGLLIAALLYAGYYLFFSAPRLSEQPVMPVPDRLAAEAGLAPAAPAPAQTRLVPAQAPSNPPVTAAPPTAAPQPPAVAAPSPPRAESPSAPATAPLPPGRTFGVQNANSRITLRVHRQSRVTVQDANNRLFINRLLMPGDTYRVPNIGGLRLTAPDSGAVELILDGASVGFAGENGVVTNGLTLSPQALAARRNRG